MQWRKGRQCCKINQISTLGKAHCKIWSIVWQSQSVYAELLAIQNCHLPSSTEVTNWRGDALSMREDVLIVDCCRFSVMHDYAMLLGYSCFKNYILHNVPMVAFPRSAGICSLLHLPCPKEGLSIFEDL